MPAGNITKKLQMAIEGVICDFRHMPLIVALHAYSRPTVVPRCWRYFYQPKKWVLLMGHFHCCISSFHTFSLLNFSIVHSFQQEQKLHHDCCSSTVLLSFTALSSLQTVCCLPFQHSIYIRSMLQVSDYSAAPSLL